MAAVENWANLLGSRPPTFTYFNGLRFFPQLWTTQGSWGVVLFHEVPPPFPFFAGQRPCPRLVDNLWRT